MSILKLFRYFEQVIASKADRRILKIPCVLKILSKPRGVKNSPATGVSFNMETGYHGKIDWWREGTGTRPDYLANRADQKNERPLGKKMARKSSNSWRLSSGGVGAQGHLTQGANWCKS